MPNLPERINLWPGMLCVLALLTGPAFGQATPPKPAHARPHHRHRQSLAVQLPSALGATTRPEAPKLPGSPAPVPDETAGPPTRQEQAQATDVSPTVMQLHYPETGNGYLPGSSPSALDDEQTPKAGGVQMTMPLNSGAAAPLPSPTQSASPP